jgi:hypothetical protein
MTKQISAKIIADSVSALTGVRLTTFELEAPRIIWSEVLVHRVFSRNAASTRAIPVATMISKVWNDPFMPVWWGKNQPGMQAAEELTGIRLALAKLAWKSSSKIACGMAWTLAKIGMHKQIAGRVLEPFSMIKAVVTTTEIDNWYALRAHKDAQPEIFELAMVMFEAQSCSSPKKLWPGQWHLPYVVTEEDGIGSLASQKYYNDDGEEISLELAIKISTSCCAQVSYRKNDPSPEKAESIYDRLINSNPPHMSPAEHQATPDNTDNKNKFTKNLRTWISQRHFLEK